MRLLRIAITLCALAILSISCSGDPLKPRRGAAPNPLDQTPRENYEAEVVALTLSGQLVAPQDLYEEARDGLDTLRSLYNDSIPELQQIYFRPCWVPGEVTGLLTESAPAEMRAGTYTEMDSLNAALRLVETDTTSFSFRPEVIYFDLTFEGRLHPDLVAEMYEDLPSVEYASAGGCFGDASQYYPWLIEGGVSYLFEKAWGDCPSGCIYSEFWYFRVIDDNVEYVGHWDPQSEPRPEWWAEANDGICQGWTGGYCED
jgi:hypothetical protein